MTLITFQDGSPILKDGKIGTEQACCCGKCAVPCPDYCCPEGELGGFPPNGVFYLGDASQLSFTNVYDCEASPQADLFFEGTIDCGGDLYSLDIQVTGDISCAEIDADHPTEPGCGRNCTILNPDIVASTSAPCFDPANIVLLYCPECE